VWNSKSNGGEKIEAQCRDRYSKVGRTVLIDFLKNPRYGKRRDALALKARYGKGLISQVTGDTR
jgi:hypothetical protein